MTAFILSSAIAFAFYQLLAVAKWPPEETKFRFHVGTIALTRATARTARRIIRAFIVVAILLFILTIHNFASPIAAMARYEVNIMFGFIFGPLLAIWINRVVVHNTIEKDLSRGQLFAAIGLVLLFFLGAFGDETAGLIKQYARTLSSVKVAGAELSFTPTERTDRVISTPVASATGTYVPGGPQALQTIAALDIIIQRDSDYLTKAFAPKGNGVADEDMDRARDFASASIAPSLSCLSSWVQQTGDSRAADRYLSAYADVFGQLEALNARMNPADGTPPSSSEMGQQGTRLEEISRAFNSIELSMAVDIALSATQKDVLEKCRRWFDVYCAFDEAKNDALLQQCLKDELKQLVQPSGALKDELKQLVQPSSALKDSKVQARISYLAKRLGEFVSPGRSGDTRGLERLPYFAIARASLMAQRGQHEAAAGILDNWLQRAKVENRRAEKQKQFLDNPPLRIEESWLALRLRWILAAYVEDWFEEEQSTPATVVQTEHLENLRAAIDGFKARLMGVSFFKELDDQCQKKCEPAFRRPGECNSDEPNERLALWRRLYSSYVTAEYAYIHRALKHPDYRAKFAETVNDMARRLVNYDLSCGAEQVEVVYSQSILAFAENAVGYSRARAGIDGADAQKARLDEAERAANIGLEIVDAAATADQERSDKRYLDRIAPSFAVQVQENLKLQLQAISQVRKELAE